jgi:hypothetical protein
MSRQEALDALEAQLKAKPPSGLGRLSANDLQDLAAALSDARHAQAAELKAAGDKAFAQIPWLLRGPIRKIMR